MNYRKIYIAGILSVFIYFLPQNIYSDNIEKANQYYEKYDYKYAIEIYEKIMSKKPSLEVAQKLANSYRFINNTEASEKAYARLLTFPGFDPLNYKHYADALKQNGKFEDAKKNYILYSQSSPLKAEEGLRMANSADVARMWSENADANVRIENELALNTEYAEFSPVKFNNGFIFVSDRWFSQGTAKKEKEKTVYGWTGNPYLKLYFADMTNPIAPKISILPQQINNEFHNATAVLTANYDTIFFTRTEINTNTNNKLTVGKKSIFFSKRVNDTWSGPQRISLAGHANSSIQHPALSPGGDVLYFASNKPGGLGGMDIYASKKSMDGVWGMPVNCGPNINTEEDEVFPYVHENGKFYFSSKGHVGMGGLDVLSSTGAYNEFSPAENLKFPMNSSKDDFGILFTDSHSGYISSNRKGSRGLDDIYHFTTALGALPIAAEVPGQNQKKAINFSVEGEVMESLSGLPMKNIAIHLFNQDTGEKETTRSNEEGKFRFDLNSNMDYVVRGDREEYFSKQEGEISTKNLSEPTIFTVKFELAKAQEAYLVRLNNIYYNFNKWDIRKDAKTELNRVTNFARTMSDVKIELRSHTDSRGSAAFNLNLSQKRAQSAVNYLLMKGINSTNLVAVGLGENELLNRCDNNGRCSKKAHQLNRRTEFKVIKTNQKPVVASIPMASIR
ncbi:MAG TPA: OmpA family protein [Sphingobacteriaceae bacterium]|nr:OmpA family protein [Sphingobacteriaceae bacterium]